MAFQDLLQSAQKVFNPSQGAAKPEFQDLLQGAKKVFNFNPSQGAAQPDGGGVMQNLVGSLSGMFGGGQPASAQPGTSIMDKFGQAQRQEPAQDPGLGGGGVEPIASPVSEAVAGVGQRGVKGQEGDLTGKRFGMTGTNTVDNSQPGQPISMEQAMSIASPQQRKAIEAAQARGAGVTTSMGPDGALQFGTDFRGQGPLNNFGPGGPGAAGAAGAGAGAAGASEQNLQDMLKRMSDDALRQDSRNSGF